MRDFSDRVIFDKPDYMKLRSAGAMPVDTHVHTRYSHDCQNKISLLHDKLRKLGLGVAITDHNEILGSEMMAKTKLFVIPGIEVTSENNKDILLYFNSQQDLRSFFEKKISGQRKYKSKALTNKVPHSVIDLIDEARNHNALVCLPHPFMRAKGSYYWFQKRLHRLALHHVDAIEVLNASQRLKKNIASLNWSAKEEKGWMGGSDSHLIRTIGNAVTVANAETPEMFLEEVRKKRNQVIGTKTKYRQELLTFMTIIKNKL